MMLREMIFIHIKTTQHVYLNTSENKICLFVEKRDIFWQIYY